MSDKGEALNLLGLRHHGQEMAGSALLNFWTKDQPDHDDFHIKAMHEQFEKMAEILGYEINRIASDDLGSKADRGEEVSA